MKKLFVLPAAALMFAACADTTGPAMTTDSAQFSSHLWQAGNSDAWHGYTAPHVTFDAMALTLCASWSDDAALADKLAELDRPAADHFSFEFEMLVDDEWVNPNPETDNDVKVETADAEACYSLADFANGTYEFRVTGMAKSGKGQETSTHHTQSAFETVVIGDDVYSIGMLGGNVANAEQNANSANFTLSYVFMLNGSPITDCSIMPTVTLNPVADVHQHNCNADTGARNIIFRNPARRVAADYTATWSFDGDDIFEFEFSAL